MKKKSIQKLNLKKTTVNNLAYAETNTIKGGASLPCTGINTRGTICFSPYCVPSVRPGCETV